jgi:peroxiredoxin
MIELGQLESRHQDFDSRHARVVAVSLDSVEDSARTQEKFPHLVIVSDKEENLATAARTLAPQHAPDGGDTNSPTTVLVDRRGEVRRVLRKERYVERFTPDEVLHEVDEAFRATP